MKHCNHPMAAALLAVGLICGGTMASCGKDEPATSAPRPDLPTLPSLALTEWEGRFDSPVSFQGTNVTMRLVWTADFFDDSTGALLVEISSPISQTQYEDFDFSYTYDGSSAGRLLIGDEAEPFGVNPVGQTITMDLRLPVGLGADSNQVILGGETTLYRLL